ncbi:MAG: hypothetical protein ACI8T1_000003 [Verrucomicrobiales bacterium]|jgi:hypothetical protein
MSLMARTDEILANNEIQLGFGSQHTHQIYHADILKAKVLFLFAV